MRKLSVATVQQRLLEAEQARHVKWETMKRNGTRLRAVGSLNDPSTKITNIKQISMPADRERKSGTHEPFVKQAEMAGNYVDKMPRGIFEKEDTSGAPTRTPSVVRMKPNQTTKQKKVTPNMQKDRKSDSSSSNLWAPAEMAGNYVDRMERGNIFSNDTASGGVKAPAAKNLHGTTRPKSSKKTANMTRHPLDHQPAVTAPSDNFPMPKDAPPKKRSYDKIKSGVLVRVNESVKARFDIVSDAVLHRMVENYRRFGYQVDIAQAHTPKWKNDRRFLRLIHEAAAARENQVNASYRNLTNMALKRLHQLCQSDYNSLYESRQEFLKTLKTAFRKIMENAIHNYRKNLSLFIGKARVMSEGALSDVEILAEGTNHQMALRLIRNKLLERFGLNSDIKFIFIDGTKYLPEQIREWVPRGVNR